MSVHWFPLVLSVVYGMRVADVRVWLIFYLTYTSFMLTKNTLGFTLVGEKILRVIHVDRKTPRPLPGGLVDYIWWTIKA